MASSIKMFFLLQFKKKKKKLFYTAFKYGNFEDHLHVSVTFICGH